MASIFRPWLPQTSAGAKSRLAALQALVGRHPTVGWQLLLALLPDRHAWGMNTYAPRFRNWKPPAQGVTPQEFWEFSSAVAGQIFAIIKREPMRWTDIASRLADFPPAERTQAYTQLHELSAQALPDEVRIAIWVKLDEELRRHREFPDAAWVLPIEELDRLEDVLEGFKPSDSVARDRWLFDDLFPDVGVKKRDNRDTYEAEVSRLREAALKAILNQGGLPALQRLASQAALPWLIGVALSDTGSDIEPIDVIGLLDSEDSKQVEFAYAYVAKVSRGRLDWLLPFAEGMSGQPLVQARLLAASEELEETWDAAAGLGPDVDAAYWKGFRTSGRGGDFAPVNSTARQLIEHGRPAAALDLLATYRDQDNDLVNPQTVVDAFEAVLTGQDEEIRLLANYEIEELLEFLRRSTIDEDALASLEWRLLPALRFDASSPILERRLARDPAFFAEILSLSFKPKSGEIEREIDPMIARNAYRLLHDWKQVPGRDELGGHIDEDRLRAWMTEARRLLAEVDRETIGEQYIGKILAHASIDTDGAWPPLAVRNMIEESASKDLETGLHIGDNDKRGVTSRGLDQGGEQEYELAQQFDRWAEGAADEWPRTAALLRSIASRYRAAGRWHDEDARRFRAGLHR